MSHKFLLKSSFNSFLLKLDQDLAEQIRLKGCPCGGKLHKANYPRSPMGLPPEHRSNYEFRLSFCCDTCRKRTTSPSVRFFGRRWYVAPILILISALKVGINERRIKQIQRHLGIRVTKSTWKRWHRWWRDTFPDSRFWKAKSGILRADSVLSFFPRCLLRLFEGSLNERVRLLLKFLSPMTAGVLRAV